MARRRWKIRLGRQWRRDWPIACVRSNMRIGEFGNIGRVHHCIWPYAARLRVHPTPRCVAKSHQNIINPICVFEVVACAILSVADVLEASAVVVAEEVAQVTE